MPDGEAFFFSNKENRKRKEGKRTLAGIYRWTTSLKNEKRGDSQMVPGFLS